MTLLVLARKYPPATGGMERVSYELARHLSARVEVALVKFGRNSDAWVPLVYLLFFCQTVWVMSRRKVDVIYLTDAVLAPLGVLLRRLYRVRVFVLVHGLDVTFDNALFQRVVPPAVSKMDRIICVSPATQDACVARGIPATKTLVIPNGTRDCFVGTSKAESRALLARRIGLDLCDAFLVLSVGRLVRRKGFHWFAENVVPELIRKRPNLHYLVVGDGPTAPLLRQAIRAKGLQGHVHQFAQVDNVLLKHFYNSADVFVAPNRTIPGDMEGFGVVLLEAASCGLPVVGTDIEGISHVLRGFGTLVREGDVDGFVANVLAAQAPNPRDYVMQHYSWDRLVDKHLECISGCISEELA